MHQARRLCVGYLRSIDTHGLDDSLDDICQEAFIAFLLHSSELGSSRGAVCYVRKALRSAYIDHLRREFGRRRSTSGGRGEDRSQAWRCHVSLEECADRLDDGMAFSVWRDEDTGLVDALARLRPPEMEFLLDKYVLGLSDAESARRGSKSVSTRRRVVAHALRKLRTLLT